MYGACLLLNVVRGSCRRKSFRPLSCSPLCLTDSFIGLSGSLFKGRNQKEVASNSGAGPALAVCSCGCGDVRLFICLAQSPCGIVSKLCFPSLPRPGLGLGPVVLLFSCLCPSLCRETVRFSSFFLFVLCLRDFGPLSTGEETQGARSSDPSARRAAGEAGP